MNNLFIEHAENGKKAYKSLLVDPDKLSVLSSPLAVRIVREITRQPGCALDIARCMQEDEQKIYYYLRKLENAGIVRLAKMERRHGMTAKIYETVAPVIATKLHDDGVAYAETKTYSMPVIQRFLSPFIEDNSLNAKIIIGDPDEHGRFDKRAKEGSYFSDFAIFLGSFINKHSFPYYKIDTEMGAGDLNDNLILLGNARTNMVIDKVKDSMPISFIGESQNHFISNKSKKEYKDPRIGMIVKMKNPFNVQKSILIIGGIRTRGTRAAIIALTQNIEKLCADHDDDQPFVKIIKGLDKEGRGEVDSMEIME
jgi:DNA-binding transcriptional ArsR family regulator